MSDVPANLPPQKQNVAAGVATPAHLGSVIVGEFKSHWERGHELTVQEFLELHPQWKQQREVVLDLIYEEYCQRLDAGQNPNPAEFAGRFPSFKNSLCNLLVAHQFMDAGFRAETAAFAWPELGTIFQGFHLVAELGRGSFARVYLAEEIALGGRLVAVKVSRAGCAEAEILGRLSHDNIVPIHSVSQDPATGLSLVCMPNLGRATLLHVLDRISEQQVLPNRGQFIVDIIEQGVTPGQKAAVNTLRGRSYVDAILQLGRQLAQALAHVHALGIYHRDLKPSNVLLGPDGRAMLLDFNLSADQDHIDQPLGGTIPYMSPEQLQMTDPSYQGPPLLLDGRADIYALGVILFQTLTGKHPFGPEESWDTTALGVRRDLLERQKQPLPSLTRLNPDVDPHVCRLIERCLAVEPEKRFASAEALASALKNCTTRVGRVRRFYARQPRPVRVSLLACLAFVASVFVALVIVPPFREPYPDRQFHEGVASFSEKNYGEALYHFNEALAFKYDPQARFWRARTLAQMNDVDAALVDLQIAKKDLAHSGEFWALFGYCSQLRKKDAQAAGYYQKAIDLGYANAAIYHNLGYIYLKQKGGAPKAGELLHMALTLDPGLQPALHALGRLGLLRSSSATALAEGLKAVEQAIALGPVTPDLLFDAAHLNLLAARKQSNKQPYLDKASAQLCRALQLGLSRNRFKNNPLFTNLLAQPEVQAAMRDTPVTPVSSNLVLDVLAYRPS